MMYRSGWAQKEGQEHILAIKIKREGWEWALKNSCLSHYDSTIHDSHEAWQEKLQKNPVRIQWDPERDIYLLKLDYRAIQVGLSGEAVQLYVNEWISEISDVTFLCKSMKTLLDRGEKNEAIKLLPKEKIISSH